MNPRPLGYEHYDARLRRLATSLIVALNWGRHLMRRSAWSLASQLSCRVAERLVYKSVYDSGLRHGSEGGRLEYDANVSSTKPILRADPLSSVALHEQVAAALRRAISDGEAAAGERLPPARDLAAVLGVNANTVFRALRALRDEGLVEFRRGRGVTVTGEGPQRSIIIAKARELVLLAQRCGYRPEELVKIIEQVA